jgi:predicted HNH restriction endonuclease
MPSSEEVLRRVAFYRQRAAESSNEVDVENSLWLANLFARMAHDLRTLELARAQTPQISVNVSRNKWRELIWPTRVFRNGQSAQAKSLISLHRSTPG